MVYNERMVVSELATYWSKDGISITRQAEDIATIITVLDQNVKRTFQDDEIV